MKNGAKLPEKRKTRKYEPEERAHALAVLTANNGNVKGTAQELGMPEITLRQWAQRGGNKAGAASVSAELVTDAKSDLARAFELLARRAVKQAADTLDDARPKDAAIIAGIATEKMLLLRGDATVITSTADKERSRLLAERYAAIRPAAQQATIITFQPPDQAPATTLGIPQHPPTDTIETYGDETGSQLPSHSDDTPTVESAVS